MKKVVELIVVVLAVLVFNSAHGQSSIYVGTNGNDGLSISANSFFEFSGTFDLSQITVSEISTDQGTFSRISAPAFTKSNTVGHPEMPAYRKLIRVPLGATATISILSATYTDIDLKAEGYPMAIYPAQPPMSKSEDIHEFVINHDAYKINGFAKHEQLSLDMLGILRDKRIARINFMPFEYDAVKHILRVYHNIEFRIEFKDADIPATLALEEKHASPCFNAVNASLINVKPDNNRENFMTYPIKYVIISDRMFEPQLQEFIEWKTQKGFIVVESYTDEATVGNTLSSIKSYVQSLYNAGTAEDPAPSFVLFVGDIQQIPTYDNGDGATDRNYFEYTGDVFPEIYYGRFSAQNPVQLQPFIDKTLQYEKYTMPDPTYLDEVLMIAGADASHGYDWGNGQINYGTINYFNEDHGITSHTYLYPQSASSSAALQQDISNGITFGNYTAHCSPSGWADPSFVISDIPNLQNEDMYCVLIGNCCSSSEYQLSECFGEAIVRAENKGAVGYIGGSNSTYWDEDYYFGVGVGNISQNPPSYYETGLGNYDRSFHDHGEEFSEWYMSGDEIIFAGNLAVSESGSSLENYYWDIYNYIGDPSLMVYYSNPPVTTADYMPLLPLQSTSFTVTTQAYAYVGLSINNAYISAALADENGIALLEFAPITQAGTADVVVTRQNGQPYIGTVLIASPTGPYLTLSDVEINDDSGNNNGHADFGESIELDISLENVGNGDAINTVSVLIGNDEYLGITKDEHTWPVIPGQNILTEAGVFAMSIASNVPDQHTVLFSIEIESTTKEIWNYEYNLIIRAPELSIENMLIDDSQSGNNNGRLDPGETATIKIINRNTGHCESPNTIAQLNSQSQYLTFTNNTHNIGTLGLFGYKYSEFEVSVDPDAPDGAAIAAFSYTLTSGEYSASKDFSKKIGLIVEDWETANFNKFEWEIGGDLPFTISNVYPYEGDYAAKSGSIGDNQISEIEIDVEVMLADSVTFAYKVSSQTNKDKLTFYINNTLMGEWSGMISTWKKAAFPVNPGNYTFKWVYSKDASGFSGYDCAWIDFITFPPLMTLTCYAGPDDYVCVESTFQCNGEATDWVGLEWTTNGDGSFDDPYSLEPVYTPGADDISNNYAQLTLTAENADGDFVNDEMTLNIIGIPEIPEIPAGPDYVNSNVNPSSEYTTEAVAFANYYQWAVDPAEAGDIVGIGTSGTINWNPSFLGTASISVKAINSCGEGDYSDGFDVSVDNTVSISENNQIEKIMVYPNPSGGSFNIHALSNMENARILVTTILGKEVYSYESDIISGATLRIDLSTIEKGLYILSVSTNEIHFTEKLILK